MRVYFCLLAMFVSLHVAEVNGISVEVSISKEEVTVGDPFEVKIVLQAPQDYVLDSAVLRDQILKNVNIVVEKLVLQREQVGAQEISYTFVSRLPGGYSLNLFTIPLIRGEEKISLIGRMPLIQVKMPEGVGRQPWKLAFGAILPRDYAIVRVSSDNEYRWIEGTEKLQRVALRNMGLFPSRTGLWITLILFVVIMVITYLYRGRVSQKISSILHPITDPRDVALRAIRDLEHRPGGKVGDIIRQYLSDEHRLPVTQKTSSEIVASVTQRAEFSKTSLQQLESIFHHSDLVKFAQYQPHEEEKLQIISTARHFLG